MSTVTYRGVLTGTEPTKSLLHGFRRSVGRNNAGRITMRHKGGGHKRQYRVIDFRREKHGIPAKVAGVERVVVDVAVRDAARDNVLAVSVAETEAMLDSITRDAACSPMRSSTGFGCSARKITPFIMAMTSAALVVIMSDAPTRA